MPFPTRCGVEVDELVDHRPPAGAISAFRGGVVAGAAPLAPTGPNACAVRSGVHAGACAPPTVASWMVVTGDPSISEAR